LVAIKVITNKTVLCVVRKSHWKSNSEATPLKGAQVVNCGRDAGTVECGCEDLDVFGIEADVTIEANLESYGFYAWKERYRK
jgi:hypothetical protein